MNNILIILSICTIIATVLGTPQCGCGCGCCSTCCGGGAGGQAAADPYAADSESDLERRFNFAGIGRAIAKGLGKAGKGAEAIGHVADTASDIAEIVDIATGEK